jgi:hypothetical protein
VDSVTGSSLANLKQLRPPSAGRSEILLVFDPWRAAILLAAGDKSGQWMKWYRTAILRAEQLYGEYLAERRKETGDLLLGHPAPLGGQQAFEAAVAVMLDDRDVAALDLGAHLGQPPAPRSCLRELEHLVAEVGSEQPTAASFPSHWTRV